MSQDNSTRTFILPDSLLRAISSTNGGGVVLVLGAGCSKEAPTRLPLASELSAQSHRRLVDDEILSEGEIDDPDDLSEVAEAVFQKTGSQRKLIDRFPKDKFRHATPNEGYLIMVALFLEGALSDTLTLNIDFAARSAMSQLGAGAQVREIRGPEDHTNIGKRNFIYLHGDIDSSPDEIILRTEDLDEAWRGRWGEIVAQRVLSGPTVVFVGLGTPASVLIETTRRIREAIGDSRMGVFVVDPLPYQKSKFARALRICQEDYFPVGWGEFMRTLAERVVKAQRADIEQTCKDLAMKLSLVLENIDDLCNRLTNIGLIGLGRLRAAWMLENDPYLPNIQGELLRQFSNLLLSIRMMEEVSGREALFSCDGIVEFAHGFYSTRILVCSGGGWRSEALVRTELSRRYPDMQRSSRAPSVALVAGVEFAPEVATPSNIVVDTNENDVVTGPTSLRMIRDTELRKNPAIVCEVIR